MQDFKLDGKGEIVLKNGLPVIIEGPELAAQINRQALRFQLGEWYGDRKQGMPYFQIIFQKNVSLGTKINVIKKYITDIPINRSIKKFDYRINHGIIEIEYKVSTTIGDVDIKIPEE